MTLACSFFPLFIPGARLQKSCRKFDSILSPSTFPPPSATTFLSPLLISNPSPPTSLSLTSFSSVVGNAIAGAPYTTKCSPHTITFVRALRDILFISSPRHRPLHPDAFIRSLQSHRLDFNLLSRIPEPLQLSPVPIAIAHGGYCVISPGSRKPARERALPPADISEPPQL